MEQDFNGENIKEDTLPSKINEIGSKNSTLAKAQRDREGDTGVLDNGICHIEDQLAQLGVENNLDNNNDEANKGQGGKTDKTIAAKATES